MWGTILIFLQILKLLIDLYKEKDQKKSEEKAEVAKEVVDAFKQTDPKTRASMLNSAVDSINELHSK